MLLSASEDKRLVLHDVRSAPGGTVASFAGHSSWVLSTDISPDGRLGLSGSVLFRHLSYLIELMPSSTPVPLTRRSRSGILAQGQRCPQSRRRARSGACPGGPRLPRWVPPVPLLAGEKTVSSNGGEVLVLRSELRVKFLLFLAALRCRNVRSFVFDNLCLIRSISVPRYGVIVSCNISAQPR